MVHPNFRATYISLWLVRVEADLKECVLVLNLTTFIVGHNRFHSFYKKTSELC